MSMEDAIGVFDSGLGGISVLKELKKQMPYENYIYFGDSSYAPYGVKNKEEITRRCHMICEFFISRGVKAIVIACNTATSACVKELRAEYPNLPIIGMEPALKPAVNGKHHQKVLVMATEFTLKEKKFEQLMAQFEKDNTIYRQPCPKLVELVEAGQLDEYEIVEKTLKEYIFPYDLQTLDSIVLGCTHFVFYRDQIRKLIEDKIAIIDGNEGTVRHVMEILKERNELNIDGEGIVRIYNSMKDDTILQLSEKLLEI